MFTTPIPFNTCPNTTCLPSKCGVGTVVMKNWEPLVFGPALAMLSKPTLSCYEDKEINYSNRQKHLIRENKVKLHRQNAEKDVVYEINPGWNMEINQKQKTLNKFILPCSGSFHLQTSLHRCSLHQCHYDWKSHPLGSWTSWWLPKITFQINLTGSQ